MVLAVVVASIGRRGFRKARSKRMMGRMSRIAARASALPSLLRPLPRVVIVGAAKAGTTSLFNLLSQHPQFIPSTTKEVHFFDNRYRRGEAWYRSHFPTFARLWKRRVAQGKAMTGEASPYYSFHPYAIARMSRDLQGAKLIMMVRDPVRRARSHFEHNVRKGIETLTFREAITSERERIECGLGKIMDDPNYYSSEYRDYSYLARGLYADQLENIYKYYDRDDVLVVGSEEFFSNTVEVFWKVCDFVGLDRSVPIDTKPKNTGEYDESDSDLVKEMYRYYRPHNERLFSLVGRDFGWNGAV